MIFHDQTVHTDRAKGVFGDCTRACVYTLAQFPMELPHPIDSLGYWNLRFFEELERRYFVELRYQPVRPGKDYSFLPRICGAGGNTIRTPSSGATHMVVYDRTVGDVLHDPHPSRDGLTTIEGFYWLKAI